MSLSHIHTRSLYPPRDNHLAVQPYPLPNSFNKVSLCIQRLGIRGARLSASCIEWPEWRWNLLCSPYFWVGSVRDLDCWHDKGAQREPTRKRATGRLCRKPLVLEPWHQLSSSTGHRTQEYNRPAYSDPLQPAHCTTVPHHRSREPRDDYPQSRQGIHGCRWCSVANGRTARCWRWRRIRRRGVGRPCLPAAQGSTANCTRSCTDVSAAITAITLLDGGSSSSNNVVDDAPVHPTRDLPRLPKRHGRHAQDYWTTQACADVVGRLRCDISGRRQGCSQTTCIIRPASQQTRQFHVAYRLDNASPSTATARIVVVSALLSSSAVQLDGPP